MKNIILTALFVTSSALLIAGVHTQSRYTDLQDDVRAMQRDSEWFSMDVYAVDAHTGELIGRAGLGHPVRFSNANPGDTARPNVGRVYDADNRCTKISGMIYKPITFTISAANYKAAEFELQPDRFTANQSTLTVELVREAGDPSMALTNFESK